MHNSSDILFLCCAALNPPMLPVGDLDAYAPLSDDADEGGDLEPGEYVSDVESNDSDQPEGPQVGSSMIGLLSGPKFCIPMKLFRSLEIS